MTTQPEPAGVERWERALEHLANAIAQAIADEIMRQSSATPPLTAEEGGREGAGT